MTCNKNKNLKNGWNRYCTGLDTLAKVPLIGIFFKDDTIFGVYIGCACKKHDIRYSKEGICSRKVADTLFKQDIIRIHKVKKKRLQGLIVSKIAYKLVKKYGLKHWRTWSSKGLARYE